MSMPIFALAQSSGITISPLTFELTADPGEMVSNKLLVTNPTGGSLIFEMEVQDFTAAGEGGEVIVGPDVDETLSMERWVSTNPMRFTLEPGKTQVVDFTVSVPQDGEPGGHYATILATIKGSTDVTGSAISQKVGSLVLLSVSGSIREELFIREFSVPSFSQQGPISFLVRFENIGSVHVMPMGFVTIADFFGNKVADVPLSPKRVLPGNTRKIEVMWDKRYPIGKFTATLVGSFGISNTPISAVTTFWVFPWKIALEVLGGLIVLLVVLIKTRKRFRAAFNILFKGEHASL